MEVEGGKDMDYKLLGIAQAYTEEKIAEAGGMTSEGVAEIVKGTVGPEVNAYLGEDLADEQGQINTNIQSKLMSVKDGTEMFVENNEVEELNTSKVGYSWGDNATYEREIAEDGLMHYYIHANGVTGNASFIINKTYAVEIGNTFSFQGTPGCKATLKILDENNTELKTLYTSCGVDNVIDNESAKYLKVASLYIQGSSSNPITGDFEFYNFKLINKATYDTGKNLKEKLEHFPTIINVMKHDAKSIPTIVFDFDQSANDNRIEILSQYGFNATFAYNVGQQNLAKELIRLGYDISPYVTTSAGGEDYTADGYESWKNAIDTICKELQTIGYYYPVMFSCTKHLTGTAIELSCADNNFRFIKANSGTYGSESKHYSIYNDSDAEIIAPYGMTNGRTFEEIKSAINLLLTKTPNTMLMLFTHLVLDVPTVNDVSTEIFTQVCDYVKELRDAGKINVLNVKQWFDLWHPELAISDDYRRNISVLLDIKEALASS